MKHVSQQKSSDNHVGDENTHNNSTHSKNKAANKENTVHVARDADATKTTKTKEVHKDTTATVSDIPNTPDIKEETAHEIQQKESVLDKADENARLKEELLRLHADMENTKKRLTRLFEDRVRDKTVAILMDIIEHIDNFERAFDSHKQMISSSDNNEAKKGTDTNAIFDGFGMIKNHLVSTLKNNWGLNTIDALHKEFNPDEHEAVMQENSEKIDHPTVVQEFMKGYTYLGKVIRPAKVKVALPKDNK